MKKKMVIALSVAVIFLIGAVVFGISKVNIVNPQPSVDLGTKFLNALKSNEINESFSFYSGHFRQIKGENWRSFLEQFQRKFGIVNYKLVMSHIVPIEKKGAMPFFTIFSANP